MSEDKRHGESRDVIVVQPVPPCGLACIPKLSAEEAIKAAKDRLNLACRQLSSIPIVLFQTRPLHVRRTAHPHSDFLHVLVLQESLQELWLESNQLQVLFYPFVMLLTRCVLQSLPEALGQLCSLRGLWLGHNKLESLPGSMKKLQVGCTPRSYICLCMLFTQSLKSLGLENNMLSDLPSFVGKLTRCGK